MFAYLFTEQFGKKKQLEQQEFGKKELEQQVDVAKTKESELELEKNRECEVEHPKKNTELCKLEKTTEFTLIPFSNGELVDREFGLISNNIVAKYHQNILHTYGIIQSETVNDILDMKPLKGKLPRKFKSVVQSNPRAFFVSLSSNCLVSKKLAILAQHREKSRLCMQRCKLIQRTSMGDVYEQPDEEKKNMVYVNNVLVAQRSDFGCSYNILMQSLSTSQFLPFAEDGINLDESKYMKYVHQILMEATQLNYNFHTTVQGNCSHADFGLLIK